MQYTGAVYRCMAYIPVAGGHLELALHTHDERDLLVVLPRYSPVQQLHTGGTHGLVALVAVQQGGHGIALVAHQSEPLFLGRQTDRLAAV